jgi:hypothetical protein
MNRQEFVTCSGLQVQTLEFWLEQRWLIPQDTFRRNDLLRHGHCAGASHPRSEN